MNYWNCAKKKQIAKEIISLLGRALYRYRRGQGSNPGKIEFLQEAFGCWFLKMNFQGHAWILSSSFVTAVASQNVTVFNIYKI